MKYLLDTCTVSDFVRGQANVLSRLKAISPREIAISSIVRMEIEFGLFLNPSRAQVLAPLLDAFLGSCMTLSFDEQDAISAATLRASLQKNGQPIGAYDVLIAGCAMARDLIVVTSNIREFGRIQRLKVENWR
jgi:tRNA(fMet)-specific endonuclease VapC